MNVFIAHTTCVECNQMIEIRVHPSMKAIYVLIHVLIDLGGKCKKCLEKAEQEKGGIA